MANNTYSDGYSTFVSTLANLQSRDTSRMNEAELKEHKEAIEAAQNPIGNFGRLLSTYNLKGGALAGLTYGAFVFGLGPVGLALAGAASFMLSKFAATHYAAYKEVAESNQFSKLEGSYFEMAKTASKNVGQFLANSTYRSAVLSMNESAIAKIDEDASFYQLGTTTPDNSGFDSKSLSVDLIAGLASVLALAYAPISAPLALLATATLPVLTASKAYGYVNNYLKKGASLGEGTDKDSSGGGGPTDSAELKDGKAAGNQANKATELARVISSTPEVPPQSGSQGRVLLSSGQRDEGLVAFETTDPAHDGGALRRSLSAGGFSDTE
ncbi:hypothetical protein N9C31_01115 [Gammaproteobacteria bacterium]|nr:hypothetical protein [Gammaproteobacteria bacterium]